MSTQAIEFEVKKPNGADKLAVVAPTPMDLLQIAVSQNLDVDKLSKLLDLQMQWEANEARKAYVVAMNAFKRNPPTILKDATATIRSKKGEGSSFSYKYAPLDTVCRAIIGGLSEQGISHRWAIDDSNMEVIKVSCILTHDLGHSEETSMRSSVERSDFVSLIQSRAIVVSYLQRYTLLAATGLAATDDADGGNSNAGHMDSLNERLEWIANAKDEAELKRLFFDGLNDARKADDKNAEAALSQAKNKRYRELQ